MNLFKQHSTLIVIFILFTVLAIPTFAFAQTGANIILEGARDISGKEGVGIDTDRNIPKIIGDVINVFFGVIGVIFLGFTLVGGLLWMTAGGNEEKVGKAKKFIVGGINGIIVIFFSYALVFVVIQAFT